MDKEASLEKDHRIQGMHRHGRVSAHVAGQLTGRERAGVAQTSDRSDGREMPQSYEIIDKGGAPWQGSSSATSTDGQPS